MPLQFQPYPILDPERYRKPRPDYDRAFQGINQGVQNVYAYKQQQDELKQKRGQTDLSTLIELAKLRGEYGPEFLSEMGLGQQPYPTAQPTANKLRMFDPGQAGTAKGVQMPPQDMGDRFKDMPLVQKFMQGKVNRPKKMFKEPGTIQDYMNMSPYQRKMAQQYSKLKSSIKPNLTSEQYNALVSGDPKAVERAFPEGVPMDAARPAKYFTQAITGKRGLDWRISEDVEDEAYRHGERLNRAKIPQMYELLIEVDNLMGGSEDYDTPLPGFGEIEGRLPNILVGKEGRKLRQFIQKFSNIQLKDRSGAAVTDSEYGRFLKEVGQGSITPTERELRDAVTGFKREVKRAIQSWEAATPKESLDFYRERQNGITSDMIPVELGEFRNKGKQGQVETERDPKVEAYARKYNITYEEALQIKLRRTGKQ